MLGQRYSAEFKQNAVALVARMLSADEADVRPTSYGFRHVCGRKRNGRFTVILVPVAKSLEQFLTRVKADWAAPQHDRPRGQQQRLTQQLAGLYQYFGLWHCYPKLKQVQRRSEWPGMRTLNRRSQQGRRAAET